MKSTRVVAFVAVVAIALIAWFALDERREEHAASAPEQRAAPNDESTHDEPVKPRERISAESSAAPAASSEAPATASTTEPTRAALAAPPTKTLLYGFVFPPNGREHLDGDVFLALTDRWGEQVTARAAADGAYSVPDLAAGRWWITAGGSSGSAEATIELDGSASEQRLDLQLLATPQVLVNVVDASGERVSAFNLFAVATLAPLGDWFDEVRGSVNNTFGVGSFEQSGLGRTQPTGTTIGRVVLDVEPPVYVSLVLCQRVLATQRVEPGQSTVTFVIDRDDPRLAPSSLVARFVDARTREPLAGMMVMVDTPSTSMGGTTDASGTLRVTRCAPGWVALHAHSSDHENGELRRRVEAGIENDFGEIELDEARVIAGRVVDDTGLGVAVRIDYDLIDRVSGASLRTGGSYGAKSSSDGAFKIGGLSRATYRLSVNERDGPWALTSRTLDTHAGSLEDVRFELVRGTALAVSASDQRWRQVRFSIFDASNERLLASRLWSSAPRKLLLAPGAYRIEVTIGDAAPTSRTLVIGSEPVELSLP